MGTFTLSEHPTFLALPVDSECGSLLYRSFWCIYGREKSAYRNSDALGELDYDTFAAMALASLPPSESVMKDKPRDRKAFILNKAMYQNILGVGGFFFVLLLVLLYVFEHSNITQLTDLLNVQLGASDGLTPYELTLFFTIFVMTHFFYLFCARAFETGKSALHFKGCKGLLIIATIILAGQIAMVEIPGLQNFFNVTGLKFEDWVIIIVGSSLVLWIREIWSLLKKI